MKSQALLLASLPPAALATLAWLNPELGSVIFQLLLVGGYSMTGFSSLKEYSRHLAARRMRLKPPEQSFVRFPASIRVRGEHLQTKTHMHVGKQVESSAASGNEPDYYDLNGTRVSPSQTPNHALPVIVIRTPYNRRLWMGAAVAFAERGFHCLLQDCRGTFGSSGDFFPVANEREDGAVTIRWLLTQPWCNGKIGFYGLSYMGLTSMAAAGSSEGHHVSAVVPVLASSRLFPILNPGSVSLELGLRWLYLVLGLDAELKDAYFSPFWRLWRIFVNAPILDKALLHVPISECDTAVCSQKIEFYQDAIQHSDGAEAFWHNKDVLLDLSQRAPPILVFAAWFDFFLKQQLEDYKQAARVQPQTRLIIAPYSHWSLGNSDLSIPAALHFFEATLKNAKSESELPVRVSILQPSGGHQWASLPSWPPSALREHRLYLRPDGSLAQSPTAGSRRYTYDAANPTPFVGGASFHMHNSGQMDQRAFEQRDDVLVYTSGSLGTTVVVGEIQLDVYVRSSLRFFDVVGRLCVVTKNGNSLNLCDGMTRVEASSVGDVVKVSVAIGSCAVLLQPDEKLRIHVCSAAHPRFLRNYGTGEPIASATTLLKANQEVLHGPDHPSSVTIGLLAVETLSLSQYCFPGAQQRDLTLPARL